MSDNSELLEQLDGTEIAVIGMTCRFPGANDLAAFWNNLRDGVESIASLTDEELRASGVDATLFNNPQYVKAAPLLKDIDMFDAAFFGFTPKEAEVMDPQQRLFLECAWQALEHAGYNSETYGDGIGVFAGARTNTYLFNLVTNPEIMQSLGAFEIGLGNDLAFMTSRVSYKLNLRGPSYSVHTACSTALVAIHLACQSLLIDECQMALAGGVAVNVPHKAGYLYQQGGVVSPDGHCRAFEANSQGTVFGSGIGIIVLKRLEDAIVDGDKIYAVIRGTAANNDGALKASFTAPGVHGQENVILEALASADVEPASVSYVEAHGTGTALGDPIEIRALTKAYRSETNETGFCALGSVKTNFGHLDAAAGIASFIKTVLALHHQTLPPTLHFEAPNPNIDFAETPFYVNDTLRPWQTECLPRRAGVSSFGIGGTNAHLILEEAPSLVPSSTSRPFQLLLLSARTESALDQATTNLIEHLETATDLPLADVAYTLQVGRKAFKHRRMTVCPTKDVGLEALKTMAPNQCFTGFSEVSDWAIAFAFPGQGAQYNHMAGDLYKSEPHFKKWVDQCATLLEPHLELDIREQIYPTDEKASTVRLNETSLTQPALFVIEYALAQLWRSWGVQPKAMIGHSIGEYVAACLAGVFSLEDALALVAARGRLMQAQPEGAMVAVLTTETAVQSFLDEHLSLAAINGPEQCVVSGTTKAIDALIQQLTQAGIEYRRLHTSHAFHSALMDPILDTFAAEFAKISLHAPQLPFVSNITGTWITEAEATNPDYWVRHLRHTVRFADGVRTLMLDPARLLLEVGPGHTLSRLIRQHPDHTSAHVVLASTRHPRERQSDVAYLLTTLGKLWLAGVSIDWASFYADEHRQRCPLPTYPFERQRFWIDPGSTATAVTPIRNMGKLMRVTDWFYVPSWKRTVPPISFAQQKEVDTTPWLLFEDTLGLTATIQTRLQENAQSFIRVSIGAKFEQLADNHYTLNPQQAGDYVSLIQALQQNAQTPKTILHLWNVTHDQPSNATSFKAAQERGYYSLLFLAQALSQANVISPIQLWMITNHLHEVESQDIIQPEKSTLLGPCKVIPQEYGHITCHSLDIQTNHIARVANQILADVMAETADVAIAYRGRKRWVQTFESMKLHEEVGRPLRTQGVYLITGGLGGVGQILATYLAKEFQAKLILTGRSALPPRHTWSDWLHDDQDSTSRKIKHVQALEALGAEVLVASVDVTDEANMQALITQIQARFGTLNGVLHAAGITSGSSVFTPIADISFTESELQFGPKAYGLYSLEKVLQGQNLDFCLLFSSNAAVLGGLGFVAYAAANTFMDLFAASRHTLQQPWISANWDHWPEETRQFTGFQTSMEQFTMTRPESEQAFRLVASLADEGQIVVSTGDLHGRLAIWIERESLQASPGTVHPRPTIQSIYVAPRNETEETIAEIWQEVLGIEKVGIHDNFFDLGGHSLLATRLIARLRDSFQVDLPLTKFFESATIVSLAAMLQEVQTKEEEQDTLEILEMLALLSEEEAEAELQKMEDSLG